MATVRLYSTTRPHRVPSAHAPPRAPPPGRGAQHFQPPYRQLAIPPQRERGSELIPNCAGHQAVDHCRGAHAGARSSQEGAPDSQQRVARAPAAAPTAAHRTQDPPPLTTDSTVALGSRTRPARILITHIACGRLAPPHLGLAGGEDTAALSARPPRYSDIPNLSPTQQLLLGAGKTPSAQRRVHPFGHPCFVGVSLLAYSTHYLPTYLPYIAHYIAPEKESPEKNCGGGS